MSEWVFVLILGAFSGAGTTVFLGGHDVPVPDLFKFVEGKRTLYVPYRIVQNTVLGGAGAFFYWVLTYGHGFSADDIDPKISILAISSGATGGVLLNTIFGQMTNKETLDKLTKSFDKVVKSTGTPGGSPRP